LHKFWTFISIVVALTGCNDATISKDGIVVLGHAGSGFPSVNNHYPTNSKLSITQALLSQGADGVEVDIQITADSQIVLYHDRKLESGTNDTGYISQKTWAELQTVSRRDGQTTIYNDVGLWRLCDLFKYIDSLQLDVFLFLNIQNQYEVSDQKSYNRLLENALSKALGKYSNLSKTIVETRDHDCIVKLKFLEKVMGFKLFFTAPITDENIDKTGLYVSGFVVNYLDETSATIQKAKDAGFEIALYGVKIRQDISPAIKFEPDYIQTDNIPLTLSYLGR